MENILPLIAPREWTATEQSILEEVFTNTTVKKYLRNEAFLALADSVSPKKPNETDQDYMIRQAQNQGALTVLNNLLGIQKTSTL